MHQPPISHNKVPLVVAGGYPGDQTAAGGKQFGTLEFHRTIPQQVMPDGPQLEQSDAPGLHRYQGASDGSKRGRFNDFMMVCNNVPAHMLKRHDVIFDRGDYIRAV